MPEKASTIASLSKKLRKNVLKASFEAGACHIGSSLSCLDILIVLYFKILKKGDAFLFSKASGISAFYSVLAQKGIIREKKVAYYLKNYPLPSREVPGVIWSGGSLGHGLPVSVGLALADKKRNVYCLASDGEMQEGTTWESALFANHHNLNNLTVIIDRNHLQACGETEKIAKLEPFKEKWRSFGWQVIEVDGHNLSELEKAFKAKRKKPLAVIAKTVKGKGVDFMENDFEWHYKNLTKELYERCLL